MRHKEWDIAALPYFGNRKINCSEPECGYNSNILTRIFLNTAACFRAIFKKTYYKLKFPSMPEKSIMRCVPFLKTSVTGPYPPHFSLSV